jgi:hypothetical protein
MRGCSVAFAAPLDRRPPAPMLGANSSRLTLHK